MFKKILAALMCVAAMVVSGCGGGGGGGGGGSSASNSEPVSITLSRTSVSVAATTTDTAPSTSVVVTADHVPSAGLYVQGNYTQSGLSSVSLSNSGNSEYFVLFFRAPASLGVGVYTDTVSVRVCRDQSCTRQVTNSPLQFTVTYTVTAGSGGTGGTPGASTLVSLAPSTTSAGGSSFILTLTGTGFDPGAQVYWNGSFRSTTYVSSTQITAQIQASDIVSAGTNAVTVRTNGNASLTSNALTLTVINAPLTLTKLSPTSVTTGNPAFVETVIGTGFDSSSTVQWNGSTRPTTFVSTTELLAQISTTDVASVATANVTVTRTGSSATSAKTVAIVAPSIDATAFQINAQHNGTINFANIVAPSAFPLSTKWTASMNGTPSYALVAGGRVFATAYLADGTSELSAFSVANGARLWGPIALPYRTNATYDNGRVFVLSANIGTSGMLSAYDAASGTSLWSTALTTQYWFTGPPTAGNGMVFVGGAGSGGTLYGVDQITGTLAWTKSVANGNNSSPTVTADGVYVSYSCQTYDFRPLTGELVWNNNTGCSGGGGATGLAANGIVYSPNGSSGYSGMSFNAETGTYVSSYASSAPPLVGSSMSYFLQGGSLRAVSLANGTTQWNFVGDGALISAPVLVNNYLFAFSSAGNLYALDATTGSQLWQSNMGGTMANNYLMPLSGLSAGGGLLVVPVGNTLVAYTLSNNP